MPYEVLVTGAAGFIGYHVAERLLEETRTVLGIDNLSPYYDLRLKRARLANLERHARFKSELCDIRDRRSMDTLFDRHRFDMVVHLAAQPGVRHSIENPGECAETNIGGFLNVLEGCRRGRVRHLIYASSSSVYGESSQVPFSTADPADRPVSLYAATKRSNELMAHCYSHLFGLGITGLRLFTVYGPWGRPDMAPFRFAQAILRGEPLDIYNYGKMRRDFTYIGDVVEGISRLAGKEPEGCRLFNLGSSAPSAILDFVRILERALGKRARKRFLPMQAGDVPATYADMDDFERFTGFRPGTTLEAGVGAFSDWFRGWARELRQTEDLAVALGR